MMRPLALCALVCAPMAAPAWANVSYNLTDIVTTTDDPNAPFATISNISFTVSDAAVASGTFVLVGQPHNGEATPNSPIIYGGNLADFVSLTVWGETVTPTYLYGSFTAAFTFDAVTKAVTSTLLTFSGQNLGLQLSGEGASASGSYGADGLGCFEIGDIQCHVSGVWTVATTVPEPSSLAILSTATGGLLWLRRRRYEFGNAVPPSGTTAHAR